MEQRIGWQRYVETYFPSGQWSKDGCLVSGVRIFVKANVMRLLLGCSIVSDAPDLMSPPPLSVDGILDVPGEVADCLEGRGFHRVRNVEGSKVSRQSATNRAVGRATRPSG